MQCNFLVKTIRTSTQKKLCSSKSCLVRISLHAGSRNYMRKQQQTPWGQKKVAIVEGFKQEWKYGLSAKKMAVVEGTGHYGEVVIVDSSVLWFRYKGNWRCRNVNWFEKIALVEFTISKQSEKFVRHKIFNQFTTLISITLNLNYYIIYNIVSILLQNSSFQSLPFPID